MKSYLKYLFFFIALSMSVYSQVTQEWVKSYNGTVDSSDYGVDIVMDTQGNIYVAAASRGSMSNLDYAVIKYNSAGVQQWVQRYNGPANGGDVPIAIAVDNSGNVYVTGRTLQSGFIYDFATVKYNSAGIQQWAKILNVEGTSNEDAAAMIVDAAGNVYVTGSYYLAASNYNYVTVKYSSSGTEEWRKIYNGTANGSDKSNGITFDNSGNICITGYSGGTGSGTDMVTIKYSTSGTEVWNKRFMGAGTNTEQGLCIAADANGNIFVAGYGTVNNDADYLLVKYNNAGDTLWTRKYNGPEADFDAAYYIAIYDTNNIYISGASYSLSTTGEDIATIKYNSAGVQQWVNRYDGPGGPADGPEGEGPRGLQEDFVNDIKLDAAGNLYITGTAYLNDNLHDYLLIKYDPSGVQKWIQLYDGPENDDDGASSIVIDNNNNIYVTGYTNDSLRNDVDCVTIKYSQTIGIQNISTENPKEFSLGQNYPNPFNPSTNITFQLAKQSFVKLSVFDITGRELETIISQELNAGTYKADWDGSKYTSGVYFYRMQADEFTQTNKMVMIK